MAFLLMRASQLPAQAQALNFTATAAEVDFSKHLRRWDGFGFNYVQTAQTPGPDLAAVDPFG